MSLAMVDLPSNPDELRALFRRLESKRNAPPETFVRRRFG